MLDTLRNASDMELEGVRLKHAADGDERRSHTMNSDLFLNEQAEVRRLHGRVAHVVCIMFHMDEAVIAWNGATYVYPIGSMVVNVRGGDAA